MQSRIGSKGSHKPNTHFLHLPGWDTSVTTVCLTTVRLCPIGHLTIIELLPNHDKKLSRESKSEPFNFHAEDSFAQIEKEGSKSPTCYVVHLLTDRRAREG